MNILIAADMEGIAGIDDFGDCLPSHPAAYARGRRLMTDEVLVAIEALRASGAERISVGDWHMVGTNIERDRMPAGVEVRPLAELRRGRVSAAVDFVRVMTRTKSTARSKKAWALAGRQHGLMTRRDLLSLGFSREAIAHRIAVGRLHPVARGVYAVGWPHLTRERRWMVAVLACGEGAALSHRSAGALWGIGKERRRQIDVSIRRRCRHRRAGIRAMSRPSLQQEDITSRDGIPVTRPARTLIDLATELRATGLERAVNEADKYGLIDPETLRAALDDFTGEPGVRSLRALLDRYTFRFSDSDLELLFRPIAVAAGLPQPTTKAMVNGYEVDFFWPSLGLVVETDGLRYHRTAITQTRDRLRDQTHVAAGLTTLRFTHWQVKHELVHVRKILRQTAQRLQDA